MECGDDDGGGDVVCALSVLSWMRCIIIIKNLEAIRSKCKKKKKLNDIIL